MVARVVAVAGSLAAMLSSGVLTDQAGAVTHLDQAAKSDRLRPELKTPPRGTPVDVVARRITYDIDADVAVATGDVVITYGNYVLVAREVVYDRRNDRLRAEGEIRLTEPGGNILEADVAELWNRFRDGFAEHLRLLLTNDATITAQYARRRDGVITVFTRVTYTRCKTCLMADGTPLWQIVSAEVTHNEEEGIIYHRDATFEFLGLPVFWLPYLSHPDPSVERRSGFLIPAFRFSSQFGLGLEVPYFWNLAPNYDITFRPLITSRQGRCSGGNGVTGWREASTRWMPGRSINSTPIYGRRAIGRGVASSEPRAISTSTNAGPGAGTRRASATTPSCATTRSMAAPKSSVEPTSRA
jgi:LPS-assembly protein